MKRFIPPVVTGFASVALVIAAYAQDNNIPPAHPNCEPFGASQVAGQMYPTAIEPVAPIWCYTQPDAVAPTHSRAANAWVDTFDNAGPAIQRFGDGSYDYRVFERNSDGRIEIGGFVNVDHWMFDMADTSPYRLSGGVMITPNRGFNFDNGRIVIEADAAAGSDAMGGADAFYEMDLTPAGVPGVTVDPLYGYGQFGGVGAVGCRLERAQDGPHTVCAMYDASMRDAGGTDVLGGARGRPGRVWETQGVGTARTAAVVEGGYPDWSIPGTSLRVRDVWRTCADNQFDLLCRDRFRMEVGQDSIHLFVNGYLVMRIEGLYPVNPATGADNRIPFSAGLHPFFTSWINNGVHHPTRWHWDRVAINPLEGPSAGPSFCLGQPGNTCPLPDAPGSTTPPSPTPTRTPTPMPTPTPTPSPVASPPVAQTACEVRVRINGVEQWHSAPASFCEP